MREICTSGSEGGPGGQPLGLPEGFSIVTVPVVFAPPRFSATTLVSREALDHRLFSPTASGVALCPRGFRMWTLVSG
jgi:hypothetical protein